MEVDYESLNIVKNEISVTIDQDKVVDASLKMQKDDSRSMATEEDLHEFLETESESPLFESTPPLKRRTTEPIMIAQLATVLDKCKISKRDVMHLLMAAAEAFSINTRNLVLNTSSIHRACQNFRKERYEAIKKLAPPLFSGLPSTIHWDGKLLPGYLRRETTDRLAIIITSNGMEQLLGIPNISSSRGINQAQAVFDTLNDWSLLENIEALCCDSTASNTGRINGACVLLERLIDKDLFYFICRHHIYELVLRSTFEIKFGKTAGPEVQLFKNFGDFWKSVDQTKFEPGISDTFVIESLQDVKEKILDFCSKYLKKDLNRSDFKECLELVMIFLGGKLPSGITFYRPGAIHHARWMAKAIYCLKIFIFRKQYLLDKKDVEVKCRDVCIFILRVYVHAWFCTPFAAQAPNQDLKFLKCLYEYRRIDESISDCAVRKIMNHLWYLTPHLTALAFFDFTISNEEKLKMCEALQSNSSAFVYGKRILVNEKNLDKIVNSSISDFICKDTYETFRR
ncbi:uncharacterized protein LOC116416627 [Nasonia vitripennis]|uniref:Uncharacterized protein n=1 Tax=Nasonia vitripennis TaxID=7425 RepID=A0A7M7Q897_NASVI|nr:uncharacterized protein LOC116416627 [Nasonia vitripennis]